MEQVKLYGERDIEYLDMIEGYYTRHIMAMTGQGLNSKSAIAAELAYRDWVIDNLKRLCESRLERIKELQEQLK